MLDHSIRAMGAEFTRLVALEGARGLGQILPSRNKMVPG